MTLSMTHNLQARWEAKIMPEPNSGCWLWTGAWSDNGYGVLQVNNVAQYAHRISYELHKGEIGSGLYIDHRCSVRCCVNPDHLDAVTPGENVIRTAQRGRAKNQYLGQTHCFRGHPLNENNVYIPPSGGGRWCRECQRIRKRENRQKHRERKRNATNL